MKSLDLKISMYFKYIIFLIALSCINYGEQEANASGFVVARFGGEHGHPASPAAEVACGWRGL